LRHRHFPATQRAGRRLIIDPVAGRKIGVGTGQKRRRTACENFCLTAGDEIELRGRAGVGADTDGLAAAAASHITGKAVTPFLLEYFHRVSEGKSLDVNVEIIKSNSRLAAEIALAL
jgi:hypothetical protein